MLDPNVPLHFRAACDSIFYAPYDGDRAFICRSWVSKPLPDGSPSPACWLIRAVNLEDAEIVSRCVREILDYIYPEMTAGNIDASQTNAIITTIQQRVRLLDVQEAMQIWNAIGVPLFYDRVQMMGESYTDTLVMPFTAIVGFHHDDVEKFAPLVPRTC